MGLLVSSVEVISNASFMVIMPLTFISNAFVPSDSLPGPLRTFAEWNPVSAVTQAARNLFGKPGPDYRLYLTPEAVESKQDFLQLKERSVQVGDVKTFDNFIVAVPESVDVTRYRAVVVWCESFSQFITAAQYR